MTFDELIEKILNNEDYNAYGLSVDDVITLIEVLRLEYAPKVEMTKRQYEILVLSRNNAVNRVDKVGLLEFMSAYSLLNQEIDHLSLMQAWLHPETVKLVDHEI